MNRLGARVSRRATVVVGLLGVLVVAFADPDGPAYVLAYTVLTWGATVLAWHGAATAPRPLRVFAALVALAVTATMLGDLVYYAISEATGSLPDVTWSDPIWMCGYAALCGAVVLAVLRGQPGGRNAVVDPVLDVLTVLTVSLLVLWDFSIASIVGDNTMTGLARGVWVSYAVWDAILLALVVRALASPGSRHVLGPWFALGATCWLAADLGFLASAQSRTTDGVFVVGWLVGILLMSSAARRRPVLEAVREPLADPADEPYLGRLAIAVLPLLVPPAVATVNEVRGASADLGLELVAMVVLVGLTLARTARLFESERRARAQARKSERHYARLADNSSDAVLVVDDAGRAREHTSRVRRLLGSGDDAAARWDAIAAPGERASVHAAFEQALGRPGEVVRAEIRLLPQPGRPAWLSCRIVNLLDDPDVGGVVVSLSDISDRKEVERELEDARDAALAGSRAKSEFLATMSHEIRTPMNGVIGLTHLLLSSDLQPRQRELAEGVRVAGESLLTIINDILDFSKIEAGQLELETLDLDLVQVVEESVGMVAELAHRKGLDLVTHCPPHVPTSWRGDPARLRQVLLNLAANAVKFTESGEVVVRTALATAPDGRTAVRFEVSDTGVGIAAEDQERLFEPFSQADSSTTRKFGGTGLGLAIVRQLVTAMDGAVGVSSRPDAGSTFWFAVPLEPGAPGGPLAADELTGSRALVVHHHATSRSVLAERLAAWGVDVATAVDGSTALAEIGAAAARGTAYDVVVADQELPGLDGGALAARIASDDGPSVVLLTAATSDTGETLPAGVAARTSKPVRLAGLRDALAEATGVRRRAEATAADGPAPVRAHVLVVEDSEVNQVVAQGILEHLGYSSDVADNGVEALVAHARRSYDAILMDCQMPEMDGYQATAAIREREGAARRTPIIAMTAGAVQGDRERCLDAGMDDYVAKPVTPAQLEAALARAVPAAASRLTA